MTMKTALPRLILMTLTFFVGNSFVPVPEAKAQAKPEIIITIKKGRTVISEERARSDNPWLEVSDDELAVISINQEIHTLKGPFYGRLQRAIESKDLTISNAEKARVIKEKVRKEKSGLSLFPTGLPSFSLGGSKSDHNLITVTLSDLAIDQAGIHCLGTGPLRLIRANADQKLEIIIGKLGGVSKSVKFEKSNHVAAWPDEFEPNESEDWFIAIPDSSQNTGLIQFKSMPQNQNISVESLIAKGCETQARRAAISEVQP